MGSVISDASPPKSLLQKRNLTSDRVENLNGTKEVLVKSTNSAHLFTSSNYNKPQSSGNDSRKVNGAAAAAATVVHTYSPGRWFFKIKHPQSFVAARQEHKNQLHVGNHGRLLPMVSSIVLSVIFHSSRNTWRRTLYSELGAERHNQLHCNLSIYWFYFCI